MNEQNVVIGKNHTETILITTPNFYCLESVKFTDPFIFMDNIITDMELF
ncbi:hypothetical protein SDC9_111541 [bioreactor metagenome]|uniref:Uncharacterized protein n=1 Tax=bioreactor metagenome TaxID=1076179 RepID=A0A645BMZ3_9ZZZZ